MNHLITRVRHETRRRLVRVRSAERLTPNMVRVVLAGDELDGFFSAAHDDHIKLFFPESGAEKPVLPVLGPDGPVYPDGVRPVSRDYTPRHVDAASGTLTVDFALHAEGPASDWARQAKPGDYLGIGGPRGSYVVSDDFDWYLLVGDEAALPAIARRLGELPTSAQAIAVIEVADKANEQPLPSKAQTRITWLHRDGAPAGQAERLLDALWSLSLPEGDGFAWVAAEADVAKTLRRYLLQERGLKKEWLRAAGYWRHGAVAAHETIND